MLLEDFIEKITSKVRVHPTRGNRVTDIDDGKYSWRMPSTRDLAPRDTEENYRRQFIEAYFYDNADYPDGEEHHVYVAQCIKDIGEGLYEITYNKTGKTAAIQYYLANGDNRVVIIRYSASDGWVYRRSNDKTISKFLDGLNIRKNLGATHLICTRSFGNNDIVLEGKAIGTPMEGFTRRSDEITEFREISRTPSTLQASRKWIKNGISKVNEIINVQVVNGEILVERVAVEEDWWGKHIPDFKIPFFGYATPFNTLIHEHLDAPEYMGKNIWVIKDVGTSNTSMLIKIAGHWIPVYNPESWDLAGIISQEVADEYALYKSLYK